MFLLFTVLLLTINQMYAEFKTNIEILHIKMNGNR